MELIETDVWNTGFASIWNNINNKNFNSQRMRYYNKDLILICGTGR